MDRVSYQKAKCFIVLWEEVFIDLIGPRKVINGRQIEFIVLTCIDTVSNLVDHIWIQNKTVKHIHDKFT